MINLDEIEAKAKAATPGPWESTIHCDSQGVRPAVQRVGQATEPWPEGTFKIVQHVPNERDADHIATVHPTLILDWVKETKALREALRNTVFIIEQLIPEPSARGVAGVVLSQARQALKGPND